MARQESIIAVIGRVSEGVAASLEQVASERGVALKIEVAGKSGAKMRRPAHDASDARAVVAIGVADGLDRFASKPLISIGEREVLSVEGACTLIDCALLVAHISSGGVSETQRKTFAERLKRRFAHAGGLSSPAQSAAADMVDPSSVLFDLACATRDDVLRAFSEQAVACGFADSADELMQAFLKREVEGTTGMMDGFAIPHAKSSTVRRATVMVAKLRYGVKDWEAMDTVPVRVAIALLIPEGQGGATHLKLLSRVAEALMDDDFREALKAADDARSVADIVNARLA